MLIMDMSEVDILRQDAVFGIVAPPVDSTGEMCAIFL